MLESLDAFDYSTSRGFEENRHHNRLARSVMPGGIKTAPSGEELIHVASRQPAESNVRVPGSAGASKPSVGRRERGTVTVGAVLKWTVRLGLLGLMVVLTYQQAHDYLSEPLSSTVVRRQARFPRLTLCPGGELRDTILMRDKLLELANGSLSIVEFYNQTSLHMMNSHNSVNNLMLKHGKKIVSTIPVDGPLGVWKSRFYLPIDAISKKASPMRCITFHPSEHLHALGANVVNLVLQLRIAPLFTSRSGISYRLFVHGDDEPNVGDLTAPSELGVSVPTTTSRELRKSEGASLRVTARLRRLASVRRRPCRSEPGYSLTRCLKECLWRRLADHIGCRLPHMVAADVYLPEIRGPLDHLPFCTKFVGRERWRMVFCRRVSDEVCLKESFFWSTPKVEVSSALRAPMSAKHRSPKKLSAPLTNNNQTHQGIRLPFPFPQKCHSPPRSLHLVPFELMSDLQGCNCLPACHQAKYYLQEDVTGSNRYGSDIVGICETILALRVDLAADLLEESGAFTLPTLLANIGGLVGLITGFSLFTVANFAEALIHTVAFKGQANRRPKVGQHLTKNSEGGHRVQFVGQWNWQPREFTELPSVEIRG